jgi:hypothetical protein
VAEQAGPIEQAVGGLAYAGEDEAVLAEERGDVGLLERAGRAQRVRGLAALRRVELAGGRVEHGGDGGPVLVLQRDRAAPAGQAARERNRAVDAVDQPAAGRASGVRALLAEDGVSRAMLGDRARGGGFGERVRFRDEIGRDALRARVQGPRSRLLCGLGGGLHGGHRDANVVR